MPAGGRHAIAEPAGEQACVSKMPPGGTARKCAHLCTPGTPPAEAPWSAHPCALATCPGGSSWPAPPYAPGTPSGESSWPAPPYAPATPPGESSWPPQPHALGTQGGPPRSKALPPHTPGGPAAKLQWRATNQQRTSVEPKTALPSFNTTTPQHHNDDHHPGELRTLIAERSYARDIGPLTDAARRGIVDCVERGMSAELALALEISARYQARSWEYVSRTLQSVLNGSHNQRREAPHIAWWSSAADGCIRGRQRCVYRHHPRVALTEAGAGQHVAFATAGRTGVVGIFPNRTGSGMSS